MIKKGDAVRIKPQWQDKGDDRFAWIAIDDAAKGRVTISPINSGLAIPPSYVVTLAMLEGF